jgi:DNA-binding Lrp family transcriptional regulator
MSRFWLGSKRGENLYTLDSQEIAILGQLIRDPRISDNQIAKKTNLPVKSVNRKRKKLEEAGILNYFTYVNHTDTGTGILPAKQMHIIKFKEGITRKSAVEAITRESTHSIMTRHIEHSWFGEDQGRLLMIYILESYKPKDLLEIFNAEIVPWLHRNFGNQSIQDVQVIDLTTIIRVFHNYLPGVNMKEGYIKPEWNDQHIFIK